MKPNANHPLADSCMDYIVNKFRTCLGGIPQVNKFEQVHIQSNEGPPPKQTDRQDWKHYLLATSLASGKYKEFYYFFLLGFQMQSVARL